MTYAVPGRVRWSETDASGRIHNTAAIRWAEAAEHDFLATALPGLPADRLPRRQITVTFHHPLVFRDDYEVCFAVERVGRTSVTYRWTITHPDLHRFSGSGCRGWFERSRGSAGGR